MDKKEIQDKVLKLRLTCWKIWEKIISLDAELQQDKIESLRLSQNKLFNQIHCLDDELRNISINELRKNPHWDEHPFSESYDANIERLSDPSVFNELPEWEQLHLISEYPEYFIGDEEY